MVVSGLGSAYPNIDFHHLTLEHEHPILGLLVGIAIARQRLTSNQDSVWAAMVVSKCFTDFQKVPSHRAMVGASHK